MSNKINTRVLKDISQPNYEEIVKVLLAKNAALEAQVAANGAGKEPRVYVGEYTPKKGKNAGIPEQRLFVEGNFFPLVLKQDPCKLLLDNIETIKKFAKTGKA